LLGLFCWEDAGQQQNCTIYYGFERMKEEQVLLLPQKKKTTVAAEIEPVTSR
jgi:hypothetical protein